MYKKNHLNVIKQTRVNNLITNITSSAKILTNLHTIGSFTCSLHFHPFKFNLATIQVRNNYTFNFTVGKSF